MGPSLVTLPLAVAESVPCVLGAGRRLRQHAPCPPRAQLTIPFLSTPGTHPRALPASCAVCLSVWSGVVTLQVFSPASSLPRRSHKYARCRVLDSQGLQTPGEAASLVGPILPTRNPAWQQGLGEGSGSRHPSRLHTPPSLLPVPTELLCVPPRPVGISLGVVPLLGGILPGASARETR